MTAEHGTPAGISAVMAPHPDRLWVWCLLDCGCFRRFTPPPCFGSQGAIDLWFDERRDSVATQMEGK